MSYNTTPPSPPNGANLDEIYKYILSLNTYLRGMNSLGNQTTQIPIATLNQMVTNNDLEQADKMFTAVIDPENTVKYSTSVVAGMLTLKKIT